MARKIKESCRKPPPSHTHTHAHTRTREHTRLRAEVQNRQRKCCRKTPKRRERGAFAVPERGWAAAASRFHVPFCLANPSLVFQDSSDQRDMAKQPACAPTSYIPMQQPDVAAGFTTAPADVAAAGPPPAPHHHPAPPPPCNESKSFCPTENKPGEVDGGKAYGTFKNAAPAVPGSAVVNSAFRKDSAASTRGGAAHNADPLRATAEQNNTTGSWAAMSQTTIILGTDGNTSVQPASATAVSGLKWRGAAGRVGQRGSASAVRRGANPGASAEPAAACCPPSADFTPTCAVNQTQPPNFRAARRCFVAGGGNEAPRAYSFTRKRKEPFPSLILCNVAFQIAGKLSKL